MKNLLFYLLLSISFIACTNNTSQEITDTVSEETNSEETNSEETVIKESLEENNNTINAKFVGFEFGDVAHFLFEDETGKQWDFSSSMTNDLTFETETEDGFGPNQELLNKTFQLVYEIKKQPLYPDGPIGDVMIIIKAKLIE